MDLLTEYQTASTDRRCDIEAALVQEHRPLTLWCAKRYFDSLGKDDACQEASIVLLLAIRRFNPQRGKWRGFNGRGVSRVFDYAEFTVGLSD